MRAFHRVLFQLLFRQNLHVCHNLCFLSYILQLENENRQLRSRLEQAEKTISEMGNQMELQKTRTRQLIAGWKLKLEEGEDKMAAHSKEKDEQLASLLSQLMFFEGCLKKEREEIMEEIKSKNVKIHDLEKTVKHQKRQIDALNRANERLLTSLHDTMNGRTGDDGEESDDSSASASSSGSHSSVNDSRHHGSSPNTQVASHVKMARRKASMPAAFTMRVPNGSSTPIISNQNNHRPLRQRKTAGLNGVPSLNQFSSDSASPESPRRRVRFDPGVQNNNSGEDSHSGEEMTKKAGRLRKISLPAYRLPTDEEGSIRYF